MYVTKLMNISFSFIEHASLQIGTVKAEFLFVIRTPGIYPLYFPLCYAAVVITNTTLYVTSLLLPSWLRICISWPHSSSFPSPRSSTMGTKNLITFSCGFYLHFTDDWWCWESNYMSFGHFGILFGKMFV